MQPRWLLLTLGLPLFASCESVSLSRAKAQIEASPTALDFGEVAEGARAERTLTLKNLGGAALTITKLEMLDDPRNAFSNDPLDANAIAAGATRTVVVRYAGGLPQSFDNARLFIESNADNAPALSIPLLGRGVTAAPDAGPAPVDTGPRADAEPVDTGVFPDAEPVDAGFPPDAEPVDTGAFPDASTAPGRWATGTFGACSNTCGNGTRSRTVRCEDAGGSALPEARCTDPRPADAEACTEQTGCACTPSCPGTCAFPTPGEYSFTMPAGCGTVRATLWGGGGGGGNQLDGTGGGGAYAEARFSVTGTLDVWVAEGGRGNGDGAGASYLRQGSNALLVAAGGGGGGSDGNSGTYPGGAGGAGGATQGEAGQNFGSTIAAYCTSATGGQGGGSTAGGQGGTWTGTAPSRCNGEDGAADQGGSSNGGEFQNPCYRTRARTWRAGGGQGNGGGGGGGAGYFGGGGAGFIWTYCGGGGGGGSSFAAAGARDVIFQAGARSTQGNAGASGGAGAGGARLSAGSSGRVEITFEP